MRHVGVAALALLVSVIASSVASSPAAADDDTFNTCGTLQALTYANGIRSEDGSATIDGTTYQLSAGWAPAGTNLIKRSASVGSYVCLQGVHGSSANELTHYVLAGCSDAAPVGGCPILSGGLMSGNPLAGVAGWLLTLVASGLAVVTLVARSRSPLLPAAHAHGYSLVPHRTPAAPTFKKVA